MTNEMSLTSLKEQLQVVLRKKIQGERKSLSPAEVEEVADLLLGHMDRYRREVEFHDQCHKLSQKQKLLKKMGSTIRVLSKAINALRDQLAKFEANPGNGNDFGFAGHKVKENWTHLKRNFEESSNAINSALDPAQQVLDPLRKIIDYQIDNLGVNIDVQTAEVLKPKMVNWRRRKELEKAQQLGLPVGKPREALPGLLKDFACTMHAFGFKPTTTAEGKLGQLTAVGLKSLNIEHGDIRSRLKRCIDAEFLEYIHDDKPCPICDSPKSP